MQVSERRQTPREARGVTLHCDACDRDLAVVFPYGATVLKRQQLIKRATDEHRKIGCAAAADLGRAFRIDYQRQ